MADYSDVATAVVIKLAPFLPFLVEAGKAGSEKLAKVVAEKGGEAAWSKAQGLWNRIKARLGSDSEVTSATTMVATKPEDATRRKLLAEVLSARLQENPELAQEVLDLLGEQESVQEVLASVDSSIKDIIQSMEDGGKQQVKAVRGSKIERVSQHTKKG